MKSGELIGVGAVVAILLGVLMAVMGPGTRFGTGWQYLTSGGQTSSSSNIQQSSSSGVSIVGSPSLSAQQIDTILANAGSPAVGTGQTFYNDGVQSGIDPAYALAFFHHESSYGTAGAATETHNVGNIVCTAGYPCIGRFRAYPSWAEGIDDWYRLIKNVYIGQWNATTVESIIPHYAPSSDGNSESGYIASVESDVNAWRSL